VAEEKKKRNPFEKPKFVEALQHVYKHETDQLVNDPKDAGGETKYGISKNTFPNVDIKNLSQEDATKIYEREYWNKIQGEQLPRAVGKTVLDSAVLSGQSTAVKALQKILGNKPDGNMGEKTVQSVLDYTAEHGEDRLAKRYNANRAARVKRIRGAVRFGRGWTNRIKALEE
jgi:lysozyme family protein